MAPTLRAGDWLLVDPDAYADRAPLPRDLVLVPDPRHVSRVLVKRVEAVSEDEALLFVTGDAAAASTDSRTFGPVDAATVRGKPWFCYWPPGRIGPVI